MPSKRLLVAGLISGGMHIIDLDNKKEIRFLTSHTAGVFNIKHSVLNNVFISASGDGTVCFWNAEDFSLIKSVFLCNEKVRSIAVSPDENNVCIGSGDGQIRIFNLKTLELINTINAHHLSVNALIYHPHENILLSGGRDAHLNVWDIYEWKKIKTIPAHNYAIYSICFSANGKIFFTASRDKSIKVWDAVNYEFKIKIDKTSADGHQFSVNKIITIDNLLISCSDDKKIMGWQVD